MSPYEKLIATICGYQSAGILAAACELDLFTRILRAENSTTVEDLALESGFERRGLETLLLATVALDFVERTEETFSVKAEFAELLDSRTADTAVPAMRHWGSCMRQWSQLATTVRNGFPAPKLPGPYGAAVDYQSFLWAMNTIARRTVGPLTEKLREAGLLNFRKMLDVGGASGTYTKAFLQQNPEAQAILFDLPVAITEAKDGLADSPLAERISLVVGDFYQDELPGGVDWVWISAILHQHDDAATVRLLKKAYCALVPGGRVGIRDVFFHSDKSGPSVATFFAVNMLCNTTTGKVYTVDEVFRALETAGFQRPRLAIPADDMSAVIVAEKD